MFYFLSLLFLLKICKNAVFSVPKNAFARNDSNFTKLCKFIYQLKWQAVLPSTRTGCKYARGPIIGQYTLYSRDRQPFVVGRPKNGKIINLINSYFLANSSKFFLITFTRIYFLEKIHLSVFTL